MHAIVSAFAAVFVVAGATRERLPAVCGVPVPGAATAFAIIQRHQPADSLATITVCLVADTTRWRVAGYHGEVAFGASTRVVHVDRPPGATRIENTTVLGHVAFAGVAPQGLPIGPLLSFTVAGTMPAHDADLHLTMLDITDVEGRDVTANVQVDSVPHWLPQP
ncbi:MAG TPA: hypothetical protein VGM67_20340 [Gemmatimonadaceae bacterium]|jgi:hypothetical protein